MSRADVNGSPGRLYIKIPPAAPRTSFQTGKDVSWPSMRRVLLPTLVAFLLLLSQASPGARPAADLDGSAERGLSLRLRLLLLGEDPAARWPLPPPLPAPLLGRLLHRTGPTGELRQRLAELGQRLKRQDPPLSIDLTFYLLRQMMEISRAQSQQAQAEQNRLLFDSVGK